MTSLMIVPDDILLELFKQSKSIDDSIRLGMCCRRMYWLLDRNRLGIMRDIIVSQFNKDLKCRRNVNFFQP